MKLRCRAPQGKRTCNATIGETDIDLELVAVVKQRTRRAWDTETKQAFRCHLCRWVNVYRVLAENEHLTTNEAGRSVG